MRRASSGTPDPDDTVVEVTVGIGDYDRTVDILWQFEPEAVSEQDGPHETVLLVASFPDQAAAHQAIDALDHGEVRLVPADDGDWLQRWRSGEPHHRIGRFCLCLPEHLLEPADDLVLLTIEPSTTFGFSHGSTRLALTLLAELGPEGMTVADVGCGSGVLAIAAALIGADTVHAVDIDAHAVDVTNDNAIRNGVDVVVNRGSVKALPDEHYELILLNVTAATSSALARAVTDAMVPGGRLIVSGLLSNQRPMVLEAFATLILRGEASEAGWTAVHLAKPGPRDHAG